MFNITSNKNTNNNNNNNNNNINDNNNDNILETKTNDIDNGSSNLKYLNYYKRIYINAVCPGWCRTDMGTKSAPRSVNDGAKSVLYLALNDLDKIYKMELNNNDNSNVIPNGLIWRDGKIISHL